MTRVSTILIKCTKSLEKIMLRQLQFPVSYQELKNFLAVIFEIDRETHCDFTGNMLGGNILRDCLPHLAKAGSIAIGNSTQFLDGKSWIYHFFLQQAFLGISSLRFTIDVPCHILLDNMSAFTGLKTLQLDNSYMSGDMFLELIRKLPENLESFRYVACFNIQIASQHFRSALNISRVMLTSLYLNKIAFSNSRILGLCLSRQSRLQNLALEHCRLTHEFLKHLDIPANLVSLNLDGNSFGSDFSELLVKLQHSEHIETVSLMASGSTIASMYVFESTLRSLQRVKSLKAVYIPFYYISQQETLAEFFERRLLALALAIPFQFPARKKAKIYFYDENQIKMLLDMLFWGF